MYWKHRHRAWTERYLHNIAVLSFENREKQYLNDNLSLFSIYILQERDRWSYDCVSLFLWALTTYNCNPYCNFRQIVLSPCSISMGNEEGRRWSYNCFSLSSEEGNFIWQLAREDCPCYKSMIVLMHLWILSMLFSLFFLYRIRRISIENQTMYASSSISK